MGSVWNIFNGIVLLALIGAVMLDLKTKRVDNRFVVGTFLIALTTCLVTYHVGGIVIALAGIGAALAVALPAYLLKVFGGGDFKLILAVSPLLDWRVTVTFIMLSFFWGALLGVVRVLMAGEFKQLATNLQAMALRNKLEQKNLHVMPFTVALLFGFLSTLSLRQIGWGIL